MSILRYACPALPPESVDAIFAFDLPRAFTQQQIKGADSTLWIVKERQPIIDSSTDAGSVGDSMSMMVEVNGIEPMTPCLQSRCSPS